MQGIMNVAFGHSNMDMDCLGSLILVKALFPDYQLVKSNFIHPTAQKVYNIYRDYFDFKNPDDLDNIHIDDVIIVDTCVSSKVKEYFDHIKNKDEVNVRVIDHHNLEDCDIPDARTEGAPFGANVTYLGKLAMAQGIVLTPETATIALTGLYADTGRLLYENVRREDFEVSGYLVEMGASLKMVKTFLESFIETQQLHVLNQLFVLINHPLDIQGHTILSTCLPLDNNVNGLNTVVDKVMEVENPDAYFAFFSIPKKNTVILIARSRKAKIDLHNILLPYGGGGHLGAGALTITNRDITQFSEEFLAYLEKSLKPATRAGDIMTKKVEVIKEDVSLLDASRFLEKSCITGVPVVNAQGGVVGFLSLRDISKGRKAEQMHAPVKSHMTRNLISADRRTTMREVEHLFYKHNISRIPVVENGLLLGIITQQDYLQYKRNQN